ncbi:MAG: hypothetical protein ABEJ31_04120 [Haloarculaceae archaeon]
MASRLWSIVPALLAGVLIGAVGTYVAMPPVTGTTVPSHGTSTATGCERPDDPPAWTGYVPEGGEYKAVYLSNYSYAHDAAAVRLRSNLTETRAGHWRLALTTTPSDSGKDVTEQCQPRTLIDASVAIPTSAESLTITLDGDRIANVSTTAHSPRFAALDRNATARESTASN